MTADEAMARLHALGYWCVELEVTPDWCCAQVWMKYRRADRFCASGTSIVSALESAIERAEKVRSLKLEAAK